MQTTTVAPAPDSATVDFTREQLLDACRRLPGHSEAAAAELATSLLNLAAANGGKLSVGDLFVRLGAAMAEAPATGAAARESGGARRSVLGAELPAEGADDEILSVKDLTLDEVKKQAPPGTSQRCACPRTASPAVTQHDEQHGARVRVVCARSKLVKLLDELKAADLDGDGVLSQSEFLAHMIKEGEVAQKSERRGRLVGVFSVLAVLLILTLALVEVATNYMMRDMDKV